MTTQPSTRRTRRRGVQRHLRSRRIRALLASGLVLGAGATITLAAWNDSEHATGSVTAGHFSLEGSANGNEYQSSESGSAHTLSFSPEAEAMFPGSSTYSLFSVRTTAGSLGGTVHVQADEGNVEGLGAFLTYGVRTVAGTTCDADTFEAGQSVVERGSDLTTDAAVPQELAPNQEGPVNYCLELRLPEGADNEAQNASVAPYWEFFGTSVSE